jgi:hypothetical protein
VSGVDGDVDLDGIEGDMNLRDLAGGRTQARVVDGNIRADEVRSAWVRLQTTTGEVVFVGPLHAGAHYDLRSYAGDVRVVATGELPAVALRARAAVEVETSFALRGAHRQGQWLLARLAGPRAPGPRAALLEVSSVLARVVIQPNGAEPVKAEGVSELH